MSAYEILVISSCVALLAWSFMDNYIAITNFIFGVQTRTKKDVGNREIKCKSFIEKVKSCYEMNAVKRIDQRNLITKYDHNCNDPITRIFSAIDDIDISQLNTIIECTKQLDPNSSEFREFSISHSFNDGKYNGNNVTFITGIMQMVLPDLTNYLIDIATNAAEIAGWRPHISHLGIRCIEKLIYNIGGELGHHLDDGSIYTFMVMFNDDYTGGDFQILKENENLQSPINYRSPKGGGILFNSNKLHGVKPVELGSRHVLVMEFWPFVDADCVDHRPFHDIMEQDLKIPHFVEVSKKR